MRSRSISNALELPSPPASLLLRVVEGVTFPTSASKSSILPSVSVASDAPETPCFLSIFVAEELSDFFSVLWLIPAASVTL